MHLTTGTAIDATRDGNVQPLGDVLRRLLQNRGLVREPFFTDSDTGITQEDGYSAPQTTFAGAVSDRPRLVKA